MRILSKVSTWQWRWRTPFRWVKDFFPLIALATACIAVGLFDGSGHPSMNGASTAIAAGPFADPAYLAIFLYRSTGNAMFACTSVVLVLAAAAYWLRQKIRLAYGVLELCIGVLIAGLAIAQMARDTVAPDLTAAEWSQDLFRMATGIYFVVRGMTNTKDGIDLRPRRNQVEAVGLLEPSEPVVPSPDAAPAG